MNQKIYRRRRARQLALKMLFPYEFQVQKPINKEEAIYKDQTHLSDDVLSYAQSLVKGVLSHQATIDQMISAHTTSWTLERMVSVDKVILRIGTYEIKYLRIDPSVVINETIEIAKEYSTLDSSRFINGVLDSIQKEIIQQKDYALK